MTIKSPYLASAGAASERRSRALHRTIVAAPLLLIVFLGLVGHLRPRPFPHPAATRERESQILAYRERVVEASRLAERLPAPSVEDLTGEARRWIGGYASGRLVTLPPIEYEDHLRDGVRSEILYAGLGLSDSLLTIADVRLQRRPTELAQAGLIAAETAQGLRSFEAQAFVRALVVQRRAIGIVAKAAQRMPTVERRSLRERLARLIIDESEIGRLERDERNRVAEYRRRQHLREGEGSLLDPQREYVAARRSLRMSNAILRKLLERL